MSRHIIKIIILAVSVAGCTTGTTKREGKLTLHQADSIIGVRQAYQMPFPEFIAFTDSLRDETNLGNMVSVEYHFHSVLYSYNLNHSLKIPYTGFTSEPDYRKLIAGVELNNDTLLRNEEYKKFIERYLDLASKYMIEAGDAPRFDDNMFINTQFYIADKFFSGAVRQYALYKIMMLQINTFGIDNIDRLLAHFKEECNDKSYLMSVMAAYDKMASLYRPATKVVYKVAGHDLLNAYITYPEVKEPKMPVVLLVHEGGWYNGHPGENMELAKLFNKLGFVAISVEYRLKARQNATPVEALKDVKSAIRWIRSDAAALNIDPDRLIAGGVSAGGQLVAASALIPGYEEDDEDPSVSTVPNAVILWSGCVDPTVDAWFGYCLRGTDKPVNLSPTHHVHAGAPPFLVFQGTSDEFLDYHTHIKFQKKLEAANDYCNLVIYKGKSHFQVLEQDMQPVIEDFIKISGIKTVR